MDCYNCGATLNRKTRSAEHILPYSIGGKRKAYNLLCKTCNEKFGRTIDNELAAKLSRFYSLLNAENEPKLLNNRKDGNIISHERLVAAVKKNRSFGGSAGYLRSIAKICLNYYLTKGYSKAHIGSVKAFIRGESTDRIVYYYAPDNGITHDITGKEISHILHLHGSPESGLLYAYIELFNMQNLIVIFSKEYDGEYIDVTYCRDLIRNEELSKNIKLDLTRKQVEQLETLETSMEESLYPRFERLLEILEYRQD